MLFDPFELDTSVTPGRIRAALRQKDFTRAILMAVRLNEKLLLQETLEAVPWDESERQARLGRGGGAGSCQDPAPTAAGRGSRVLCTYRKGMSWNRLVSWFEFFRSERGFPSPLQLTLSAPPSPSCTWRKCLSFWLHPLKCLAIWNSTSFGLRSCSWRMDRS